MRALQHHINQELRVKPMIDPIEEIDCRTKYLAEFLGQSGARGYVLGISGGQDSLLAGVLAQRAVDIQKRRGQDVFFHATLLPYGEQRDRADALAALDFICPDAVHDLDIKPSTDAFVESFDSQSPAYLSDFDRGNVKARVRMIAHYALAAHHRLLVIGTDHAAEAVTGFYTKYGDGGADILPLAGLNKRQGRQMLEALGAPRLFIEKLPTADLLDSLPGQSDEAELDITYDDIDDYLEGRGVDSTVAAIIEQRYINSQHKRRMPYAYGENR